MNTCLCSLKYFPRSIVCFSFRFSTKLSQKIENSSLSDFKCSKKNLNHVDIRLIGLQ